MTMADRDDFDELEGFFRAARAAAPEPSATLLDRIAADAAAETARRAATTPSRRPARGGGRIGFWHLLVPALGGPGVLAGLAGAMVAGAWIGITQPAPIAGLTERVTGQTATLDQVDLLPALSSYLSADASGD